MYIVNLLMYSLVYHLTSAGEKKNVCSLRKLRYTERQNRLHQKINDKFEKIQQVIFVIYRLLLKQILLHGKKLAIKNIVHQKLLFFVPSAIVILINC